MCGRKSLAGGVLCGFAVARDRFCLNFCNFPSHTTIAVAARPLQILPALVSQGFANNDALEATVTQLSFSAHGSQSQPVDAAQLRELVRRRIGRRVKELHLCMTESGVVLTGCAYSWFGKQLAQHAVMELTGMRVVRNEIVVVPPRCAEHGAEVG